MNEDLNKALLLLVTIQHEYPAVYRAFGLDEVAQHILDSQGPVMLPFIQAMTNEELARFTATNNGLPGGTWSVVTFNSSLKKEGNE